ATPRRKLSERVPRTPLHLACIGCAGGDDECREADVVAHANPVYKVGEVEGFEKELHAASSTESQRLGRPKVDRLVRMELQYVTGQGSEAARRTEVVDDVELGLRVAAADRHRQTRWTVARRAVSVEVESRIRRHRRTAHQLSDGTQLRLPGQFGREGRGQDVSVVVPVVPRVVEEQGTR